MNLFWTEDRIEQLRKMRSINMSYEQIAAAMGITVSNAKTAHSRYVNGKKADPVAEQERNSKRREQISAWGKENRERVNAGKRKRRAEQKSVET